MTEQTPIGRARTLLSLACDNTKAAARILREAGFEQTADDVSREARILSTYCQIDGMLSQLASAKDWPDDWPEGTPGRGIREAAGVEPLAPDVGSLEPGR